MDSKYHPSRDEKLGDANVFENKKLYRQRGGRKVRERLYWRSYLNGSTDKRDDDVND